MDYSCITRTKKKSTFGGTDKPQSTFFNYFCAFKTSSCLHWKNFSNIRWKTPFSSSFFGSVTFSPFLLWKCSPQKAVGSVPFLKYITRLFGQYGVAFLPVSGS